MYSTIYRDTPKINLQCKIAEIGTKSTSLVTKTLPQGNQLPELEVRDGEVSKAPTIQEEILTCYAN